MRSLRHDDHERRAGLHHAADGTDLKLLHGAVDRGGQLAGRQTLLRLDDLLLQCGNLASSLLRTLAILSHRARLDLSFALCKLSQRRLHLLAPSLLHGVLAFVFTQ